MGDRWCWWSREEVGGSLKKIKTHWKADWVCIGLGNHSTSLAE